jgi:uncharacterized membrane protein
MLSALLGIVPSIIDKIIPDPQAAMEAKLKLVELTQAGELKSLEGQIAIITAEASSQHWLTANWRPITMLVFVFIIANNYILYPYLSLFWNAAPALEIPPDMWGLLKIGLGGYVLGRSAEKAVTAWKTPKG